MHAEIVLLHAVIDSEDRVLPPRMCFHGVFAPYAITNKWTLPLQLLVGHLSRPLPLR